MSSTVIIITVPPKNPNTATSTQSMEADFNTIYDKARAIIAEAEANNTPIWFRDGTEEPQT